MKSVCSGYSVGKVHHDMLNNEEGVPNFGEISTSSTFEFLSSGHPLLNCYLCDISIGKYSLLTWDKVVFMNEIC